MKTKLVAVAAIATAAVCLWTLQMASPPPAESSAAGAPSGAAPASGSLAAAQPLPSRLDATPVLVPAATATVPTPPRGRLLGRVVDPIGAPVCPARVYAFAMRNGRPTEDGALVDDVDELGEFELIAAFDGDVLVVAIPWQSSPANAKASTAMPSLHTGLTAAARTATLDRQETRPLGDLRLDATVAILGSVLGPGGEPMVGVPVGWAPEGATWGLQVDAVAVAGLAGGGVLVQRLERSGGSAFAGGHATDATGRFAIATTAGITGFVFLFNATEEGAIECLVRERQVTAPAVVDFRLLAPACVRVLSAGKPMARQVVRFEIDGGHGRDPRFENYRTDDHGDLRILREREAPLRGRILRPGREPLVFDVPADAIQGSPLVVDLGTALTTRVQVVLTSEVPLRTMGGALSRLDVPSAPILLQPEPGSGLLTMAAEVPAGRYRLRLSQAHDAADDDTFVIWHGEDITVGATPLQVPVAVQHGGRIRIDVKSADGRYIPGKLGLVDAAGKESKPNLRAPDGRNGPEGEIWAPGPLLTASAFVPGRYEILLDLGAQGTHRQFVDVRRCEISDVTVTPR